MSIKKAPTWTIDLGPLVAVLPAAAGGLIGVAGLFAGEMGLALRIVLTVLAGTAVVWAWIQYRRLVRRQARSEVPINEVEKALERFIAREWSPLAAPVSEALLRSIFASGSGRLSIYEVDSTSDKPKATRVARFSSAGFYSTGGRSDFDIEQSFLRELSSSNTTMVGGGHVNASGEAPDWDVDPEGWREWQRHYITDDAIIAGLRMHSRKYSWFAIKDPQEDGRLLVLMAETADPAGIVNGKVDARSMAMVLPTLVNQIRVDAHMGATVQAVKSDLRSKAAQHEMVS